MDNNYIQNEAKNGFKNWTSEGWDFLLHNEQYKDIAITTLSKILEVEQYVEFTFNNLYYEVFVSADSGYVVNIYSSDEKDEDEQYLEQNLLDGGLCSSENSKDAIEFML